MPKRAIYSDKVFKGSLPFAQATIAGGFMFVCCVGRDRAGKFAVGDVRAQTQAVPRQHPRADRGGRRHDDATSSNARSMSPTAPTGSR